MHVYFRDMFVFEITVANTQLLTLHIGGNQNFLLKQLTTRQLVVM